MRLATYGKRIGYYYYMFDKNGNREYHDEKGEVVKVISSPI
jgi:hypothetical protein